MKKWLKRLGLVLTLPALLILGIALWAGYKVVSYGQNDNETHLAAKQDYLKSLSASVTKQNEGAKRPNIIFILYDDLGYGDFGATGSSAIKTPNIDTLAGDGVQLSNFYSPSPVCTPSRAGFLTGRHAPRAGLPDVVFPTGTAFSLVSKLSSSNNRLPAEEITIADMLKASGYRTGMIGKWHMGDRSPSLPNDFGFDQYYGALYSNDMTPFALYRNREIEVEAPADQTKMNALYTNEAKKFIEASVSGEQPFFLYFAHNFPHIPLFVPKDREGTSDAGLYGDVIESLDWGIGQLVDALKASGQYDNTIIIITSDNGPWYEGSAGPVRGRKGQTFEGGMRVPLIVHWPAGLQGGKIIEGMSMGTDLLPTLADWLQIPLPEDRIIDGRSVRAMLESGEETPHDYLYFFASDQLMAVRDTRFKYADERTLHYGPEPMAFAFGSKHGPWLLDMQVDPDESYNSSLRHPEEVQRLSDKLKAKRKEMEDNLRGWTN